MVRCYGNNVTAAVNNTSGSKSFHEIMKLKEGVLFHNLDFDTNHCLFSLSNTRVLYEYFCLLDVHLKETLNDVQFYCFMRHVTNLGKKEIMLTFDMLDSDADGEINFEEFYILACILLSSKHNVENNFLYRHPRPAFEMLDLDGNRTINLKEFKSLGFLFNLKSNQLEKLFSDFDTSHDERLNYKEFQMFTILYVHNQEHLKETKSKAAIKDTLAEDDAS